MGLKGRRENPARRTEPPGLAARTEALRLIAGVLDRGRMIENAGSGLAPEVRAQAEGLADLVLRRLGQLDDLLARFVTKKPGPPVDHALRLVAAELCFAGTPAHAALDMGVRAVKAAGAPRMAGLVNAVGRRIAEQGSAIAASQDAAHLSMPPDLAARLADDWGEDAAALIARAHLEPPPHDLTLRDPGEAETLARTLGGRSFAGSVRIARAGQISALDGFAEGRWWVQDLAASLPARLLGDIAGRRVLDLCAAPGGKTLQLAAAGAEVTALDVSAPRMERVRENLARTGLDAQLVVADALAWEPEAAFDAILLDAPCSATGTIRRHPDLPHRDIAAGLPKLIELQARLLDRAFGWLAPGGRLVFCTCSLLKAEGEDQIAAFLARTPGARPILAELPALPWAVSAGQLRTRPDQMAEEGGLDGFFAASIAASA